MNGIVYHTHRIFHDHIIFTTVCNFQHPKQNLLSLHHSVFLLHPKFSLTSQHFPMKLFLGATYATITCLAKPNTGVTTQNFY